MLVVLIVLFAIFVPHFLVLPNVLNVLRSSSYLVILAVGQMLVLMVGGFDLSVGAVVALTSVSSALVMAGLKVQMADHPALIILAGVLTGLACGFLVGLVNGLCVAFLSVSPFMVTLGTASIATGFALLLDQRHSGLRHAGRLCRRLRTRALAQAAERRSISRSPSSPSSSACRISREWVATSSRSAAICRPPLSLALPTQFYLIRRPMCSARFSLRSAVLRLTAQIGSGQAAINSQLTLESIAAAVIAGVSLKGGVGKVEMVALGALFLLILTNAMDLLHDRPAHSDDLPWHHRRPRGRTRRALDAEDEACLMSTSRVVPGKREPPGSVAKPAGGSAADPDRGDGAWRLLIEPRVLSAGNLRNILIQSSYLVLFASAQMVVILTRGFDLSLGASVSAISVASALVMTGLDAGGAAPWIVVVAGLRHWTWVRLSRRAVQRRVHILARHQSLRGDLGQPQHLPWPRHHDFGRTAGVRRPRPLQFAPLQRQVHPRRSRAGNAGGRGLRASVFPSRSHGVRQSPLFDRQ